MNKFKDMQFFCSVVEKGNFARAAKAMQVTPAIVGRRISNLEAELGFALFNRTTRRIQLTPAGQDYYQGAKRILSEVNELEDELKTDNQVNPSGTIHLSAPDGLANKLLIEAIKTFKEQYPNIRFILDLDNQPMDLIENEIDITFRLSFDLQDSSYIVTKLAETTFGLYASHDYLKDWGKPKDLQALQNHQCIHMGASRYSGNWTLLENDKTISYKHDWEIIVSNTNALINSIKAGLGIGMVPKLFIEDMLLEQQKSAKASKPIEQEIVEINGVADFPILGLYALYPTKKHLPYRIRLFLDFMKDWFKDR